MPGAESAGVEWPANRVRDTFFKFFEEKNHVNWKSSPVVPVNDPTLLFANAGIILLFRYSSVSYASLLREAGILLCFVFLRGILILISDLNSYIFPWQKVQFGKFELYFYACYWSFGCIITFVSQ